MKYGRFTALVLALNLVFDGVAFAGHNNDIEINSDRNFTNNETITSDKRTIIGSGVTITIAPDAELRLINNNTTNDQASVVETGLTGASDIAFNGGKLILRREGDGVIIRANGGTTSALTFNTESTLLNGTASRGIDADKSSPVVFADGFTLNLDRSGSTTGRDVAGLRLAQRAHLNTTFADGRNSKSLKKFYGFNINNDRSRKEGLNFSAPIKISLQDALNTDAIALRLVGWYDYHFADSLQLAVKNTHHAYGLYVAYADAVNLNDDLTINFSGNTESYGIFNSNYNYYYGISPDDEENQNILKIKTAAIYNEGGKSTAVLTRDDSITIISESLTTNAQEALYARDQGIIEVQRDFVTTAESMISAWNNGTVIINSLGKGKVQFSGVTRFQYVGRTFGGLYLTVGSGNADENSYWNVTGLSQLSTLTIAPNASLNFLLTAEALSELTANKALITAYGTVPVILHSSASAAGASTITLSGAGLNLQAGDEIRLIESYAGVALDDEHNLLTAGTSLNELKGNLNVKHMASLSRVQESDLTKDDYDLTMKSSYLLTATIKNKRPNIDKVNDQTNALMQSSIASAAAMYAADELLIDSTMKSRQGVRQTGPFAAARAGKYDLDVAGALDTTVTSGLLGYAFNLRDSEVGAFLEMGHGTYDTRTAATTLVGETKGDGKHNYVGFGVYGNYTTPMDWLHVTGYVKGGWLRNEFSVPLAGVKVDFDRTSNYWGAHLGAYGEFQASEKFKSRTFLNYFYDGRESEMHTASGSAEVAGAKFHFASFNSHRAQLGSVFEYAYTADLRPYIALTYEYTFKADAKGRAADQYGDLADLEGSTGIVSLGWTYQNEARDFEFDAGMNGYAGKRRGISAQLQAAWKF
ncbi:autotransporter outer membrane beta-barrel domain-containing protein [Sutterella wadsworthensis]|uniref:autotransporter outer membrane beta-barrel domain-containing protein n=1 Tax=Sutterella wadsworthensis TaxID=40545 RepID=UPI0030806483